MSWPFGSSIRAVACGAAVVLAASHALAQPAPGRRPSSADRTVMRLDFHGVPGCSDAETFALRLTRRVHGWDPLAADGPWRVVLTIEHSRAGYNGKAELYDPKGELNWTQHIPPKESCFVLLDRLALYVALYIDPREPAPPSPPAPAPVPAPAPEPPKPPECPEPPKSAPVCAEAPKPPPAVVPPAPPVAPERPRFVPRVGAGGWADFGPTAGALFGVTLEGGFQRRQWRWGGWSLMGTFRWAPQQVVTSPPTSMTTADAKASLIVGNLAGCVYRTWHATLAGCIAGELGELQQSAGGLKLVGFHQTALFAGGGVGARSEFPLPAGLYLLMATRVLGVGKLAGSTSASNNISVRDFFPGVTGGLGAGLGIAF